MLKGLFKFGGSITKKQETVVGVSGAVILLLLWYLVSANEWINPRILPNPVNVLKSFHILYNEQHLVGNIFYTVSLNLFGYIIALTIAIPLGFAIGVFPGLNAMFRKYFEALRYLPLPTVSGLFIAMFGIGFVMKARFLAFGIMIFTLPAVVQKIIDLQNPANEKDNVYIQTGKSLGMNNWQMFRYIYFPFVMSKIYSDIRSLVAISYTYVVIAECLNKEGGIGATISTLMRQSRTPEVYALLFVIVMIGIFQDFVFKKMEPVIFPFTKKKQ